MKNHILVYGIGTGTIMSILSILAGLNKESIAINFILQLAVFGVLFTGLLFGIIAHRKTYYNDSARFGQAYHWGTQILLFAVLTQATISLIYFNLDTNAMQSVAEETERNIEMYEMDDEQADAIRKFNAIFISPGGIVAATICCFGTIGLILNLIAAKIAEKENHLSHKEDIKHENE